MILACDENGIRLTQYENLVYSAKQLVPDGILPEDRRFCYIVKPVCCQNLKLGFMLFQANEKYQLADFQTLSNSIGTNLNSVLLIKEWSLANINLETANQALRENQQKLLVSEKMASLGRLTAGIAHEMNTPLAAIRASLKTLLDKYIHLYGDARLLVQLITNLVLNGIEACKSGGGTITVTLTSDENEFAEILVEDTGCGIPSEILSRIFNPMFTNLPYGEGIGLGLNIIHDLVKEFGGAISVNSQKGSTRFKIKLPLV